MTKSKTFWAAAAGVCLAAMAFSGYSIYERVSLHFSGDTLEVRPVPMPVEEEADEADEAKEAAKAAFPAEEAGEAKKAEENPAKTPAAEKQHAVKTVFEYKDAKARTVLIAGSFTSWKNVKMAKKNGVWRAEIYILPGTYPYHFTVDGRKKLDPGKPKAPTGDSLVDVN
ncbi:MAG: glycogen-binding domain-containing protein [Elusimicrobiales bacterium]